MSNRTIVLEPMLDRVCVIEALNNLKISHKVLDENSIIINEGHHNLNLTKQVNGSYYLYGESYIVHKYKDSIVNEYKNVLNIKIQREEELKRIEEERKKYVESQKKAIINKAKKMGYKVQEVQEEDNVRLVLIKRTYD
jgi:hypothetical protein